MLRLWTISLGYFSHQFKIARDSKTLGIVTGLIEYFGLIWQQIIETELNQNRTDLNHN